MAEKPAVPLWAAVAVAAGVGLAGVVGGYLAGSTATRPAPPAASAPGAATATSAGARPSGPSEASGPGQGTAWAAAAADREALIQEHLARNMVFFGDDLMQRIRGAFVVVVGLGGVGTLGRVRPRRPSPITPSLVRVLTHVRCARGPPDRQPRGGHAGAQRSAAHAHHRL